LHASDTPLRRSLLIAGGDADPNITALLAAAERSGVSCHKLLVGKSSHPSLTWDIGSGKLMLDDEPLECGAAFVRPDVFTALNDGHASSQYRAMSWHTAVIGWLAAHPEVFIFNRRNLNQVTNKPLVLKLAQDCGLAVPQTLITNDRESLASFRSGVVKPINGGGYCEPLTEALERTPVKNRRMAAPAIVQQRLVQPEVRVYAIGDRYFAFNVISRELDYRSTQNCRIESTEVPNELRVGFRALLGMLGLDFAAADFKTCPDTGRLLFLEVNNGPMFAAFDRATSGELCLTMVHTLVKGSERAARCANK
jgi:glutathione synthase/RimK-type ligase-like ATP-grasp enzyme